MPTYFVRRCLGLNGQLYPEIWHDCQEHPQKSVKSGTSIKFCAKVTKADIDAWELEAHGTEGKGPMSHEEGSNGSRFTLLDYLSRKYPEPEERKEVKTVITEEEKK